MFFLDLCVKSVLNVLVSLSDSLLLGSLFVSETLVTSFSSLEYSHFKLLLSGIALFENSASHSIHSVLNFLLSSSPLVGSLLVLSVKHAVVFLLDFESVLTVSLLLSHSLRLFNFILLDDPHGGLSLTFFTIKFILFLLLKSKFKVRDLSGLLLTLSTLILLYFSLDLSQLSITISLSLQSLSLECLLLSIISFDLILGTLQDHLVHFFGVFTKLFLLIFLLSQLLLEGFSDHESLLGLVVLLLLLLLEVLDVLVLG